MDEIEGLNLINEKAPHPGLRKPTNVETWLDRVGFALLLVDVCFAIFYRWPKFILLIYFPTFIPFVRVLVYNARSIGEAWMRWVIVEFVSLHCLVLVGAVYIWKTMAITSQRLDYSLIDAFLMVLLESCVMALLLRFQRPKQVTTG